MSDVAVPGIPEEAARHGSRSSGATKFLWSLTDGNAVESVLMRYRYGYSACVSSQVGCRMGCAFCASAIGGFSRNLEPSEMVGQVLGMARSLDDLSRGGVKARISRVVLMGMGEPLDNYDSSLKFMRIINEPLGLNIGFRHMTVSTCGLVPGIRRLAREGVPVTLSVSLHAADDHLRREIMPIARAYPLAELMRACGEYADRTGRRVSFEYALIKDVNDSPEQGVALGKLLRENLSRGLFHVNLIPLNPVSEKGFSRSPGSRVQEFRSVLENMGVPVTVRRELGIDIDGACGQLRRRVMRGGSDGGKRVQPHRTGSQIE